MTWEVFLGSYIYELNLVSVLLRLLLAIITGTAIGINRGVKRRTAGFKTHTVVCIGAALVMMTGQFIFHSFGQNGDIARLGAQVISGVGFLGVGTIIVTGNNQVKGLTTAASLWTCSCIGLAIGIGFYSGAIMACLAILLVFRYLNAIDKYVYKHSCVYELYMEFETMEQVSNFLAAAKRESLKVTCFQIGKPRVQGDGVAVQATLEAMKKRERGDVLYVLNKLEGIKTLEEM